MWCTVISLKILILFLLWSNKHHQSNFVEYFENFIGFENQEKSLMFRKCWHLTMLFEIEFENTCQITCFIISIFAPKITSTVLLVFLSCQFNCHKSNFHVWETINLFAWLVKVFWQCLFYFNHSMENCSDFRGISDLIFCIKNNFTQKLMTKLVNSTQLKKSPKMCHF
mgnify:CR=1 FL=1